MFTVQVIDQPPHRTRAQQRADTRQSILDGTIDVLIADGYAALSTRQVAARAGIAQSTVMHHFPTREALLEDAVVEVALRLAERALERVDLAALRTPAHREAVLDETWREFTSPQALAAAQIWAAAFGEPELAPLLRTLEGRLNEILISTSATLFPELADDPRLPALLDAAVSLIRGLVFAVPVWGRPVVTRRWEAVKPLILAAADEILPRD